MAEPDDEKHARFAVVHIGASAGGLEALEELGVMLSGSGGTRAGGAGGGVA